MHSRRSSLTAPLAANAGAHHHAGDWTLEVNCQISIIQRGDTDSYCKREAVDAAEQVVIHFMHLYFVRRLYCMQRKDNEMNG